MGLLQMLADWNWSQAEDNVDLADMQPPSEIAPQKIRPAPVPSSRDLQMIDISLNQLKDSESIYNSTVKPDIFFKRLNFSLDILLRLQTYETYDIFSQGDTPSRKFVYIMCNIETIVDNFIERSMADNIKRLDKLKTQRAKDNSFFNFANALISAFDCAHEFWAGDRGYPHYTGPLFTKNNYNKAQDIFDASCESDLIDDAEL